MDDLISRQQAINVIERTRAYIGHNMERAVGAAFIEILDDVGKDIGRLPSAQFATDINVGTKLGTNLAEVGTDCISRKKAIEALEKWLHGLFGITEADGTATIFKTIRQLPPAEPKTGRWIYHIDDLFPAESTMECNQCHAEQPLTCDDEFCPHCGAKMEVTE